MVQTVAVIVILCRDTRPVWGMMTITQLIRGWCYNFLTQSYSSSAMASGRCIGSSLVIAPMNSKKAARSVADIGFLQIVCRDSEPNGERLRRFPEFYISLETHCAFALVPTFRVDVLVASLRLAQQRCWDRPENGCHLGEMSLRSVRLTRRPNAIK